MAVFCCEKCGAIENTALGFYWSKDMKDMWPEWAEGKALCSECAPTKFKDGEPVGFDGLHEWNGEWHNRFPKRYYKDLTEEERKRLINYDKEKLKKFE